MFVMEKETLQITILSPADAQRALDFLNISGDPYTDEESEHLKEAIAGGDWTFIMATIAGWDVGGAYINRNPRYRSYTTLGMPEMQDLRVLYTWRKQGIGRAIIEAAERIAFAEGASGLGIAVGLTPEYGAAQRLYVSMGYIPDGTGMTYDRIHVDKGSSIIADDDLCLMLLKHF